MVNNSPLKSIFNKLINNLSLCLLQQLAIVALLLCAFVSPLNAQRKEKMSEEALQLNLEYMLAEGIRFQINGNHAKALAEYSKALELDPQNATLHFKIAQIYAEDDAAKKAHLHISQAVKSEPTNKFFYIFKANLETATGDFAAAVNTYELMRARTSGYEDYLLEMAAIYYYASDLDKALEIYEEAENHYGIYEQITYQKQNILLKKNKLDEAIVEGKKLINYYPGEADYVEHLVNIMVSNDRGKDALEMILDYLNEYDGDPELEFTAAGIFRSLGELDKAKPYLLSSFASDQIEVAEKINFYTRLIQRANDDASISFVDDLSKVLYQSHAQDGLVLGALGDWYYSKADVEMALKYYQEALDYDKNNFQLWQNVLSILVDQKKYDEVIDLSDEALEYYPNQAILYLFNGTAQLINKSHDAAVFMLKRGAELSTDDLGMQNTFYAQLGDAYNAIKQYDKSSDAYEKALNFNPENAHVLNNYSYFLALRKENLERAKNMSGRLVKMHPNNATYLDTYAWVLFQKGEYKEAKKILEKAVKNTNSCTILEHYGDVLFKLGEIEAALEQWNKGIEKGDCSQQLLKKIEDRKLYE